MPGFIISLVISLVLSVASYYISAKKMKNSTASTNTSPSTIDTPTVDMGRAIPVVFGRVRVKSPNLLWMGGQSTSEIRK